MKTFTAANLMIGLLMAGLTGSIQAQEVKPEGVHKNWLDKLSRTDRALVNESVGFAPPEWSEEVEWFGAEPLSWDDLRGSVIVVQSWSTENPDSRAIPTRLARAFNEYEEKDVRLITLHTPEGADSGRKRLARARLAAPVVLDPGGTTCDEFGAYKAPVNFVVDRNGTVRYAGLSLGGLRYAVAELTAEDHDPDFTPEKRPAMDRAPRPNFPKVNDPFIGTKAPPLQASWLTESPDPGKAKVAVVEFWATWCGPCVRGIPHINELAKAHKGDVVIMGISSEDASTVKSFMKRTKMDYHVGIDKSRSMLRPLQIRGIPHCIVVDDEWIIRWKGHPGQLDSDLLNQIVEASTAGPYRYRWTEPEPEAEEADDKDG